MRTRIALVAFLLLFAFAALTTCQLQINRLSNALTVRVLVPANPAFKAGSMAGVVGKSKSIVNGSSLTVSIIQEGAASGTEQTITLSGQTSVDFSFPLSATGTYNVSAQMFDAVGDTLSEASTKFNVPTNYPVVLTMYSSLLLNAVVSDPNGEYVLSYDDGSTGFSPVVFSGYSTRPSTVPVTLTLTPVDPKATITVTDTDTETGTQYNDPGTGFVYTISGYSTYGAAIPGTITITVTGGDGSVQTYTIDLQNYVS